MYAWPFVCVYGREIPAHNIFLITNGRLWNKEIIGFITSNYNILNSFEGRKVARMLS